MIKKFKYFQVLSRMHRNPVTNSSCHTISSQRTVSVEPYVLLAFREISYAVYNPMSLSDTRTVIHSTVNSTDSHRRLVEVL